MAEPDNHHLAAERLSEARKRIAAPKDEGHVLEFAFA